jgi:hypothetical protein
MCINMARPHCPFGRGSGQTRRDCPHQAQGSRLDYNMCVVCNLAKIGKVLDKWEDKGVPIEKAVYL